jgi:hypothetical protein
MEKDNFITEVQFRKFKKGGEIIAVFPYQIESENCTGSYMHLGQHSGCSWDINSNTTAAKPSEYKDLLQELISIGYDVKIVNRRKHYKYFKELYKEKEKRYNQQFK